MATGDFLPTRDSELVAWSAHFAQLISINPIGYGLTAAQATAYGDLNVAFAETYTAASNHLTNSSANIVAKNDAKTALIDSARELAGIIQRNPNTTNFQRSELGITVPDVEPTPVPVPKVAPNLTIEGTEGRVVNVRLRDQQNPDRRGKPNGVAGASVMMYVGETPTDNPLEWSLLANTTRTIFNVEIPVLVPGGSRIWLRAFWFNTKAQSSPPSAPQTTTIGGYMAQAA